MSLYRMDADPTLEAPILVAALEGWVDAGSAGTTAAAQLAEHGTRVRMELPKGRIEASCDPERVVQIIRILLDNALRHTPEGTHVTVSADRQNGAAEVTVADRGPGLSDGSRAHVFERFYTGDAARGAGLGLAIARELAERMDGHISLASRRGSTAFTLRLPIEGEDGEGAPS